MYAPPLPSCSRMCPAYEVTVHEVTVYEVTVYVCPEYDVTPECRVCSSVQAPILIGPHCCVYRGPPRRQPHVWAVHLYLQSLATGVLVASSVECSTLSGPRIRE